MAARGAFRSRFSIFQRQSKIQAICYQSYYYHFLIRCTVLPQIKTEKGSLAKPGPKFSFLTCETYLCSAITDLIFGLSSWKFNCKDFKQLCKTYSEHFNIGLFFDGIHCLWKTLPSFQKMTALIYLCVIHIKGIDSCKYIFSKFGPRPFIWA